MDSLLLRKAENFCPYTPMLAKCTPMSCGVHVGFRDRAAHCPWQPLCWLDMDKATLCCLQTTRLQMGKTVIASLWANPYVALIVGLPSECLHEPPNMPFQGNGSFIIMKVGGNALGPTSVGPHWALLGDPHLQ